jgi:hypothetical protein
MNFVGGAYQDNLSVRPLQIMSKAARIGRDMRATGKRANGSLELPAMRIYKQFMIISRIVV